MSDMIDSSFIPSHRWRSIGWRGAVLFLVAAGLCFLPAFVILPSNWNTGLIATGLSFLAVAFVLMMRLLLDRLADQRVLGVLSSLAEHESDPCVIADASGRIRVANTQAQARFQARAGAELDQCLRSLFANPSAILLRLQARAGFQGNAQEQAATRNRSVSMTATKLGPDLYRWRIGIKTEPCWKSVSLPVLSVDRNGVVLSANAAAETILGRCPARLSEFMPPETCRDGILTTIQGPDGTQPVLFSTLHRSGSLRDIVLLPVEDMSGIYSGSSTATLPVPILCLSPQGEILEMNPLAAQLVGEDLSGKSNIAEIMHGLGHSIVDWLVAAAEQETHPHSEFLRLSRKDRDVFIQVTLSRFIRDGQVCLIAVLNDATELKTLEAQFVQGQKMQAVGQLAGGVAHDFNNLLTAISGHCDLLLLRHDQSDPNYGDLVQINQNANRAAALVSQLLAFSRKQNLRPEVLDLRDTISDLIHLLNRLVGEKVRLILSHDPVLKPVRADKRQLEQVLMNLVVNARDAMPEGGEIRIETEVLSLDKAITRDRATVQPGEYVTVKVIDSGIGIPADKLQKVFEPFYTTKRTGEGTGLGLSTVYGIVKQTGGFIFVDSILHRGTEFTVYLPVCADAKPSEPEVEETRPEQGPRQGEGVVLLVEDEAPVRAFATRALRLKGYTVLEAGSAEEALTLLEDENLIVDAFVTDVVMPGMDGPTWVRKALETRPEVRVIFMSGYTEGAFGEAGPEMVHSTFLPKPFSLTQLTEAVFQQLN